MISKNYYNIVNDNYCWKLRLRQLVQDAYLGKTMQKETLALTMYKKWIT